MKSSANLTIKEKIYNEFLQEIKGIKFTPREIDTISCIIHNRKEKKIAAMLSISPRTVSTHVLNILNKLGCNSKDPIIDFIEKSGKLDYLKQYYFYLTVQSSFERSLNKVAKTVNPNGIYCSLFNKSVKEHSGLIARLKSYLKLANIILLTTHSTSKSLIPLKDIHNNIYLVTENYDVSANIAKEICKKKNNIFLLLGKANTPVDTNQILIDFREEENFYYSVLELIEKLLDNPITIKITKEFKDEYILLQESWKSNGKILFSDNIALPGRIKIKYLFLGLIITCLLGICLMIIIPQKEKVNIAEIHHSFAEFTTKFIADNMTSEEQKQLNYSLLNKVESLVNLTDDKEIMSYFLSPKLSELELLNCLYVLHSLSHQYTYHKHDGQKARKIILKAKKIAETFLQNKSDLPINFDNLTEEELYAELNMIKDLPEMYTRLLYMLGRTYVYDCNLNDSLKYFKQAAYLGQKLSIFEGFMAIKNGLEFVKNIEIEKDIQNSKYNEARKKIFESIEILKSCLNDKKEYKMSYRRGNDSHQIVIPKNDTLNIILCNEKLIKNYTRLIIISDDSKENHGYMHKISEILFPIDSSFSLLEIAESMNSRTKNSLYNTIAFSLLKMAEKQIDSKIILQKIKDYFKLNSSEDLEVIEYIFDQVRQKSKSTDYTKADAYDGLIKIYKVRIKKQTLDAKTLLELNSKIESMTKQRDEINKQLKRDGWQLGQSLL